MMCEFIRDISPVYVTTKQKAVCISFQVMNRADRHIDTFLPNTLYIVRFNMHVLNHNLVKAEKIREASDRHTELKTIPPGWSLLLLRLVTDRIRDLWT